MSKSLLILLVFIACNFALLSQATPEQRSFADFQSLEKWSKTSWGGSRLDKYSSNGNEVVVVRKANTSGVQSCETWVFAKNKQGWQEALKLKDFWGKWLDVSQDGDLVSIQFSVSKVEVVRFSIASICTPPRIED